MNNVVLPEGTWIGVHTLKGYFKAIAKTTYPQGFWSEVHYTGGQVKAVFFTWTGIISVEVL